MPEARRRWSFQPQNREWPDHSPIALDALVEATLQQDPYRTLLAIMEPEDNPAEDTGETILLFEATTPQQVRQAVESACQRDPYHYYSYKVIVDHRLGENATLLCQQSNPRSTSQLPPAMADWVAQLEQSGAARQITGHDWYTLHLACCLAGGMAHLYNFRTVDALDDHQDLLWRVPQSEMISVISPAGDHRVSLQTDMFSGALVDTRTRRQKQLDQARTQPKQIEMFSAREVAQFGVNPRPQLPLPPNVKLLLIPEDSRTEEDIERDIQREAERRTHSMFGNPPDTTQADIQTLALVPRGVVALVVVQEMCRALTPLDLA